jgi:chromosome segregation ATPase
MDWKTRLKSAVWDDGKPAEVVTPAASSSTPIGQTAQPAAQFVPMPQANDEYVKALRVAMRQRSTAFTALLQAAEKLSAVIPDPTTRLKAAFTMVAGEGRGVREVMAAIDVHTADLDAQRLQFTNALESEKTKTLSGMETELQQLTAGSNTASQQIQSMQQQIQSLNGLITKNTARAAEVTVSLSNEKAHFTSSAQQFDSALAVVKSELDNQKAVIQSALS